MSVVHPHDRFVRRSFKHREIRVGFLRRYLPQNMVAGFDMNTLRVMPDTYIDEQFRETRSDMVFQVWDKVSQKPTWVYLLFEHKSRPDPELPWVMLKRNVAVMEDRKMETGEAPVVVSLTLYHGPLPWSGPLNMRDVLNPRPELRRFVPLMDMVMVDLSAIPDDDLDAEARLTVFLYVLKHIRDGDLVLVLERLLPDLLGIRKKEAGFSFLRDVYRYIMEVGDQEKL